MSGGASWMLSGTSGYESRDAKSGELYGTEQMMDGRYLAQSIVSSSIAPKISERIADTVT